MTLATCDLAGNPHAAPVYFAASGELSLFFFSDRQSLHGQHIAQNPQVAAAIYPQCQGWRDIRGVQLRGQAGLVDSPAEWQAAWEGYQAKFPFVRSLRAIVAQNQLYVLVPHWIRWIDNAQSFGFKQEWDLR
jgi:uncharacterized protein YhbP (UPF0306 family)